MYTKAYFDNIKEVILGELDSSNHRILIAVAWFTNYELFSMLLNKIQNGIDVQLILMDDKINQSSKNNFEKIEELGGKVFWINPDDGILMHNKFCIIDDETIINGSYNWTNKAEYNHESITIIRNNKELVTGFFEEFKNIKKHLDKEDEIPTQIDFDKLKLRLEAIKNLLMLDDIKGIKAQREKLTKFIGIDEDINGFLTQLQEYLVNKELHNAIKHIESFTKKYSTIVKYVDPEVQVLKIEEEALRIQVNALDNEKTELEKIIHIFQIKYNAILGPLILKILKLKRENSDGNEKNEYAEEYDEFYDAYKATENENIKDLSADEHAELKKTYREASKLCHPMFG